MLPYIFINYVLNDATSAIGISANTSLFSEEVDITNNGIRDVMCLHLPNEIQWNIHIASI